MSTELHLMYRYCGTEKFHRALAYYALGRLDFSNAIAARKDRALRGGVFTNITAEELQMLRENQSYLEQLAEHEILNLEYTDFSPSRYVVLAHPRSTPLDDASIEDIREHAGFRTVQTELRNA